MLLLSTKILSLKTTVINLFLRKLLEFYSKLFTFMQDILA